MQMDCYCCHCCCNNYFSLSAFFCNAFACVRSRQIEDETSVAQRVRQEELNQRSDATQRTIRCIADFVARHVSAMLLWAVANGSLVVDVPVNIVVIVPFDTKHAHVRAWTYDDDTTEDSRIIWGKVAQVVHAMSTSQHVWACLRDPSNRFPPQIVFSKDANTAFQFRDRTTLQTLMFEFPATSLMWPFHPWKNRFFDTRRFVNSGPPWPRQYTF